MQKRILPLVAAAFALTSVAFVACGDDDTTENGNGDPTDTTTAPATEEPAGDEVGVRLFEWSVDPDASGVAAGAVQFNVENIGGIDHELAILRTDIAPDALPTLEDGSVDESAEGIEVVAEFENIGPGLSDSASIDLTAGSYALICNLVTETETDPQVHYAEGMSAAFEVTE